MKRSCVRDIELLRLEKKLPICAEDKLPLNKKNLLDFDSIDSMF